MKKHLISLFVAVSALVPTASAIAADLDTLPPPPVAHLRPAAYDWSGFYIGAWAGLARLDGRGSLRKRSGCRKPTYIRLVPADLPFPFFAVGSDPTVGRSGFHRLSMRVSASSYPKGQPGPVQQIVGCVEIGRH